MFDWQQELGAWHRWGALDAERAAAERARLVRLYDAAVPLSPVQERIAEQIGALEICNWRLEESVTALCEAIRSGVPVPWQVGHKGSLTEARWQRIWAYYLSLRDWLSTVDVSRKGYATLLDSCDPGNEVRAHVDGLLGDADEVKALRVELLCLHLELWLDGLPRRGAPRRTALAAAAAEILRRLDQVTDVQTFEYVEGGFAECVRLVDNGQLHPCHHKLFRRYDILISSIGCGVWRGAMPPAGTGGCRRAALVDELLAPLEAWGVDGAASERGVQLLGAPSPAKRFLAALLASLLRSQESAARTQ